MPDFRCSFASVEDGEPIIGSAPTDTEILLVEAPGPWGRDAVTDNRLPEVVRDHLDSLGLKVFLMRRYDGSAGPGTCVFHARATEEGYDVRGTVLERPEDLLGLDLPGMPAYDGQLWLVCTNGKRDRCCAELGRPIAGLLSQEWPESTWETTHLGGHRFSGTLLALPSGITLGRLDTSNALAACAAVERGELPEGLVRGRAGRTGVEQVRELHVRGGGDPDAEITAVPGPVRRQSCGDDRVKPTTRFEIRQRKGSALHRLGGTPTHDVLLEDEEDRQHGRPEDPEGAGAIDPGGLLDRLGDALEELLHDEHARRVDEQPRRAPPFPRGSP